MTSKHTTGDMKIFAVNNGSDTDFELEDDLVCGGSNAHSAGAVIIAESLEEAQEMLNKRLKEQISCDPDEPLGGTLKEIEMKKGIVLLAQGDC